MMELVQRNPRQSRNHGELSHGTFDLGGSLSKKCNGNHERGPCAGCETKETQLYTSIIVGVILRRFRARARCLKPAPLKLALACITRGRSRKHQATASEICTTPTAQPRCWVSPEPLVRDRLPTCQESAAACSCGAVCVTGSAYHFATSGAFRLV